MKRGFKVIDSELHLMEPHTLWEERLPEPYRSRTHIMPPAVEHRFEMTTIALCDTSAEDVAGAVGTAE